MTSTYTATEMEEARYEFWVMGGGREAGEAKHAELATEAQADLTDAGWDILTTAMKRHGDCAEFPVQELVIRRLNVVRIIRWHTFNKGWMTADGQHGNRIFYPTNVNC